MKNSSVNAVIFSKDKQQVLIIKRRDVPIWVIPGGAIDQGESPEEAVIREVLEETGCQVKIVRKVAVYLPVNRLTKITHLFECEIYDGDLKTGDETREIGFFQIETIPSNFFHLHREMVKDALLGQTEVFEKPLSQITYSALVKYFLKHPIRIIRFALSKLGLPINS